ncbi:parvulin-like peptidyl-prolyl isomerase [Cylindrospermum stagnale PCC 7417]|uniref:peptidylprolyl isomerase n=1 Tax=Cylindrospermum stagnale PCC 7417 TaxID=56107 RepID=K9WUB9_9NOST|nr:peptidylprolyl isomerase [Cylindrospermum stagnale]AFZ23102.1 parvulin-like peptidyl-prolyl isomerase [Cylindrospermum stagnale PCC 7417]
MTKVLQLGDRAIASEEIIPLLASYQLIPQLLGERIIDQAILSVTCTPEETAQACAEFYQHWELTSEIQQQNWRSQYDLTQEKLELLATRKLRTEKFKQATWGHKLESYFLQRKRQLDQVIYSLIRVDKIGIANELYFRIREGEESFAELARKYSQGTEAQTYGIIGPVELGNLPLNLANLLYTIPVGEVQPPVRFGEWLAIVRIEQVIPARLDEFMRQRLLKENFTVWYQQQLSQLSPREQIWMGIKPPPVKAMENLAA